MSPLVVVSRVKALKKLISKEKKAGNSIGFVPTMGALHDGHASLIKQAKKENDIVIASIFVNRLQFRKGGYEKYPKSPAEDKRILRDNGCGILFKPTEKEIYPDGFSASITLPALIETLKPQRLGRHYKGMLLVVAKLFNIVEPDRAYFGLKDPQQFALIEKMVNDFNFPLQVKGCKTVREKDGLAKSSRNRLLTAQERETAVVIYKSLLLGKKVLLKSGRAKALMEVESFLGSVGGSLKTELIDIVDAGTLTLPTKNSKEILISLAVSVGGKRLTDNIRFRLK